MSLADLVTRGTGRGPQRIVLHGTPGVGKTTFAAGAPSPIFVGADDGFGDLDAARLPVPETWSAMLDQVEMIRREKHDYRTIVVDTLDSVERMLWEHICKEERVDSIEKMGFGKGYVAAAEEFGRLGVKLDRIRDEKKMHVVCLAHSKIRTFNDPTGPGYDRYEMRLNNKAIEFWFGWADIVLFANFDATVVTNAEWKKNARSDERRDSYVLERGKAARDGVLERRLYTSKTAAYDAKNRWSLPAEMDLSWSTFAKAMKFDDIEKRITDKAKSAPKSEAPPADNNPEDPEALWTGHLAGIGVDRAALVAFLVARGETEPGPGKGRNDLYKRLKNGLGDEYREWKAERDAVQAEPQAGAAK